MRRNAFIQTFVPIVFGLGFIVFGVVAFIRTGNTQRQYEGKLQSIRAGEVQPEALVAVRKYVNPGRGGGPHIVFSSDRQPKVDLAVTRDLFNSVNLGGTIPAYYFPEGYFIPENHGGDAGVGKWFFLSLGVLLGAGILALAFARARTKTTPVEMDALGKVIRGRMDGH
jgi:hypothetical protein